ncbi:MAG TPA: uracil-DNA glycosylase family protein [Methanosarcina sp.]|nr:uracil-DNA glycosylase family protein [Methanosarcina sp.]
MATPLKKLTLDQLYELPKITPAAEKLILAQQDFSKISASYCDKVCRMKCKEPQKASISSGEVDVVIVQDYRAPAGKFDRKEGQQEEKMKQIFHNMVIEAGFAGLTYKVVTLLKCGPNNVDFVKNKPPTQTTMMKCAPYLWHELNVAKPKVIISTSTACTKALGLAKNSNVGDRGKILRSEFGPVVITQHPRILTYIRQNAVNASSGYWSADFYGVILRDLIKAAKIARGDLKPSVLKDCVDLVLQNNIKICKSIEEVKYYVDEIISLPPNTLVSWDIETTGFSGWSPTAKLLCTQFGYRKPGDGDYTSVVIPLWHRMNTAFDPDEAWRLVTPILTGKTKKIGWNVKFDRVYTAACTGVLAQNIVLDGLLAYHMLDSGINGCYSLKAAVTDFLPESGLAGYEDSLPKLTKMRSEEDTMDEDYETIEQ